MQRETELENILIGFNKVEMILFMNTHPEVFEEAVELAISNKQPYSWRATWLLSLCMKENDKRIQKHTKKIINSINDKNDGHQRELIKILLKIDLKDKYEGILFNICVTIWEQINKKPSVRFTAFKFIVKTAKKHPELFDELTFFTQKHFLETLSPGIRKSIYKIIKEISK